MPPKSKTQLILNAIEPAPTILTHFYSVGSVKCPGGGCPLWQDSVCFYNGKSDNWKVCSDSSCTASPDLPAVPALDRCDDTLQALLKADGADDRAASYCEFKVRRGPAGFGILFGLHPPACPPPTRRMPLSNSQPPSHPSPQQNWRQSATMGAVTVTTANPLSGHLGRCTDTANPNNCHGNCEILVTG
jgi:hypothetical protein